MRYFECWGGSDRSKGSDRSNKGCFEKEQQRTFRQEQKSCFGWKMDIWKHLCPGRENYLILYFKCIPTENVNQYKWIKVLLNLRNISLLFCWLFLAWGVLLFPPCFLSYDCFGGSQWSLNPQVIQGRVQVKFKFIVFRAHNHILEAFQAAVMASSVFNVKVYFGLGLNADSRQPTRSQKRIILTEKSPKCCGRRGQTCSARGKDPPRFLATVGSCDDIKQRTETR